MAPALSWKGQSTLLRVLENAVEETVTGAMGRREGRGPLVALSLHVFSTTDTWKLPKNIPPAISFLRVDSNFLLPIFLNKLLPVLTYSSNLSGTQAHVCRHSVHLKTRPLSPRQVLSSARPCFLLTYVETNSSSSSILYPSLRVWSPDMFPTLSSPQFILHLQVTSRNIYECIRFFNEHYQCSLSAKH